MTYLEKWFQYTDRQLAMKQEIEDAILKVEGSTLNLNEFLLLYFLSKADHQRLFQNDLQDKLHLSASAISRMLSKLEAKNCEVITRITCQEDKRATQISLTEQGRTILANVLKEVESSLEKYKAYL